MRIMMNKECSEPAQQKFYGEFLSLTKTKASQGENKCSMQHGFCLQEKQEAKTASRILPCSSFCRELCSGPLEIMTIFFIIDLKAEAV